MIKVLIVEDEDLIRKGIAYAFSWVEHGCVVVGEATNGQEGIQLIEKLEPDLVVTDIKMPIIDGLDMIKHFESRTFEVVIITGYDEFDYAKKAIEYNVHEYLLKPVDHGKLEGIVDELVGKINNKKMMASIRDKLQPMQELDISDMKIYVTGHDDISRETSEIIGLIEQDFYKKLTLEEVAAKLDISASKLKSVFKKDTGHTFNDFLNKYRIQMALEMISNSTLKIYEIAEEVGFTEYKYFSKVFKNYIGYSPSEFLSQKVILRR